MRLIADGQALAAIHVTADASPVERFAAEELQRYLAAVGGPTLPLVAGAPAAPEGGAAAGGAVVVGRTRPVSARPPPGAPTAPESFVIEAGAQHLALTGADDRGTLYAVYAFLEEWLGVRWCTPDPEGEILPRRRVVEVAPGRLAQRPALPVRLVAPIPKKPETLGRFRQVIGWLTKLRFNGVMLFAGHGRIALQDALPWDDVRAALLPELTCRGLALDVGHHCWDYFLSPDTYFAEHPEYFGLRDGRRDPTVQLCTTNPEVVRVFTANVLAYLREHPEITTLSLWPHDIAGGWCTCARCRTLTPEEAVLGLVNQVAGAVAEAFPHVTIGHLVYSLYGRRGHDGLPSGHDMLPSGLAPAPNVVLYWAPWSRCYGHALFSPACDTNRPFRVSLDTWLAECPNQVRILNYETTTNHTANQLVPFPSTMAADIPAYRARGIAGGVTVFSQVQNWWMYALNLWLMGHLQWDPDAPPQALVDDWCRAYFGAAAGPLREVYRNLEALGQYDAMYVRVDFWDRCFVHQTTRASSGEVAEIRARLERCAVLLAEGQRLAESPAVTRRLERIDLMLRYLALRMEEIAGAVTAWEAMQRLPGPLPDGPPAQEGDPPPRARPPGPAAQRWARTAREAIAQAQACLARYAALREAPPDVLDGVLYPDYIERTLHTKPPGGRAALYAEWLRWLTTRQEAAASSGGT